MLGFWPTGAAPLAAVEAATITIAVATPDARTITFGASRLAGRTLSLVA